MLDNKALADLVLESVRFVDEGELNPPAFSAAGPVFRPRVLLALLTYCYAIGVYGSEDVELMLREDASLRQLCGHDIPDWKELKRFRCHNHAMLQRALEETFHRAWSLSCSAQTAGNASRAGQTEPESAEWIAAEAAARIERAMFIDLMANE